MGQLPTVVLVASVTVALAAVLFTWALASGTSAARRRTLGNLQRDFSVEGGARRDPASTSPGLALLARRLTPTGAVARLDRLLAGAGRPAAWPMDRVLVTKLLLGALGGALGAWMLTNNAGGRNLILAPALLLVGWFLPEILLYNSATKRRKAIRLKLPDVLDQLTIAVEAGLGFEATIGHVGRNTGGPLGEELIRTLQDIQVGTPRRAAYRALADRVGVDDLTRFVRAIIQAEQYGVSIASVLNSQAREMRVKRRQRAEEAAMKIPVKVVFPLIVVIMPALFIVVLGPAVLSAARAFQGGLIGL